jgi:hypothetical protein
VDTPRPKVSKQGNNSFSDSSKTGVVGGVIGGDEPVGGVGTSGMAEQEHDMITSSPAGVLLTCAPVSSHSPNPPYPLAGKAVCKGKTTCEPELSVAGCSSTAITKAGTPRIKMLVPDEQVFNTPQYELDSDEEPITQEKTPYYWNRKTPPWHFPNELTQEDALP